MRLIKGLAIFTVGTAGVLGAGCANDPEYIPGPTNLEGGVTPMKAGGFVPAKASLNLPIKPETAADMTTRAALATTLGMMVPYVKVGDIAVSVEWTIKNLDTMPGSAIVELNGGNEYFFYDPSTIMLPGGDEAPPTPGLSGDIPYDVPASGTLSGTFTEDEVVAAAIDLDEISQGNFNPYAAVLVDSKNFQSFQPLSVPMLEDPADSEDTNTIQTPMGDPIPRAAFAGLVQLDLVFKPDRHMVLDYDVRIRDLRGIVPDMLMDAPADQLTTFMPVAYVYPLGADAPDGS